MNITKYPSHMAIWAFDEFCNTVLYENGKKPDIKVGNILYKPALITTKEGYIFKVRAELVHEDGNEFFSCPLTVHGQKEKCIEFEKRLLEKFYSNKKYYIDLFNLEPKD